MTTSKELLFELSNYDSKNINNKGTQIIPKDALNEIETKGVTLEFLNELKAPVFKYRTQITIHGLFHELTNNYLGGYKNLFQNKNLSIGVKWQAVDYEKKKTIYRTITKYLDNGWFIRHNSTDFHLEKTSKHFQTREQYKEVLAECEAEIKHIDKTLFFGNVSIYLVPVYGTFVLVTQLNIGAILQANVNKCIENICQTSMETIEATFEAQRIEAQQKEAQRKKEYEAELAERKAKQAPLMEAAREILITNGYELQEKSPIEAGKVFVKIETDIETGCFKFVAYLYKKEPRQKKFRYNKCTSSDLNFEFKDSIYNNQETILTTQTGWVKKAEKPVVNTPVPVEYKAPENINIEVVNYSDKAVAIFGDTKAIKDKLKEIGAKFNPFLNHNGSKAAGWILSKQYENKLAFINS